MRDYYLNLNNENPGDNNEVHTSECFWCPKINRIYLGYWNNGTEAVNEAIRRGYSHADGCAICCPEAHSE